MHILSPTPHGLVLTLLQSRSVWPSFTHAKKNIVSLFSMILFSLLQFLQLFCIRQIDPDSYVVSHQKIPHLFMLTCHIKLCEKTRWWCQPQHSREVPLGKLENLLAQYYLRDNCFKKKQERERAITLGLLFTHCSKNMTIDVSTLQFLKYSEVYRFLWSIDQSKYFISSLSLFETIQWWYFTQTLWLNFCNYCLITNKCFPKNYEFTWCPLLRISVDHVPQLTHCRRRGVEGEEINVDVTSLLLSQAEYTANKLSLCLRASILEIQ